MDGFDVVDLRYRNELEERNALSCAHVDAQVERRLAAVRAEFSSELQRLRKEVRQLRKELSDLRLEMPGWLFGFWIAAVIGVATFAVALR